MDEEQLRRVLFYSDDRDILSEFPSTYLGEKCEELGALMKGKTVIELGPAYTRLLPFLFRIEISNYIGLEPFRARRTLQARDEFLAMNPQFRDNVRIYESEALSYLRTQADESAIVVSSGVLAEEVIGGRNSRQNAEGRDLLIQRYREEVAAQLYRVTPSDSFTLHHGIGKIWQKALRQVGFSPEQDLVETMFWKR